MKTDDLFSHAFLARGSGPITRAEALTTKLHGSWHGENGVAPCPVCQPGGRCDRHALNLSDAGDRLLANCRKSGCDFGDIIAAAGAFEGAPPPDPDMVVRRVAFEEARARKMSEVAFSAWQAASPVAGTLAATYLRSLGITCPLPESLRFVASCRHPSGQSYPALLAMVEGERIFSVHRTFLRADGRGKIDLMPCTAMLGAVAGGAVNLSDGPGRLVVAQSIETALSLKCGLLQSPARIWAVLSASGMRRLRLPSQVGLLTIANDGDEASKAAARELHDRAYAAGWVVASKPAPNGRTWNDVLRLKGEAS